MAQLVLAIPAAEALGAHLRSMDRAACSFIGISQTRDPFWEVPIKRNIHFGDYIGLPSCWETTSLALLHLISGSCRCLGQLWLPGCWQFGASGCTSF